ncbi:hypothetical protein NC651_028058 [Populus alba x Populus x berolinensis]|nr:hypothetical protein NC651_028058 [Populus alba x Populus x berolinensis]
MSPLLNFSPYIPVFSFIRSATSSSLMDATNNKVVEVFDTEEELSVSLAKYTAGLSDKFAKERGSFTVVLSGVSLVKSLRKLVKPPLVGSIDWSKWHVFWVDERLAPKDHPDSNDKLAFDGNAYAINDALSAEGAADDCETCLKHLVHTGVIEKSPVRGFPKFDLLFSPGIRFSKKIRNGLLTSQTLQKRTTFTFPVINTSSFIALVVCGAGKADVVQSAVGNGNNSDMLPVQTVSPEGEFKYGRIEWKIMRERVKKEVMLVGANDLQVGRGREHLSHQKYSFLYQMTNDKRESSD